MASPVALLRKKLLDLGVHAYFLPHNDPHNNEYLSTHDFRMSFLSGFSGSSGQILVTQDCAFLWTDGRYWLAAEKQLYPEWTLMKMTEGVPRYFEWIVKNLEKGSVIGYDPTIVSVESINFRKDYFEERGFNFKGLDSNPVNDIWHERPQICKDPIVRHEDIYAGKTCKEKIAEVAEKMSKKWLFTNALDEIAWLLNLRGNDIDYNPVFFSYLVLEKSDPIQVHLFIDAEKLVNVRSYLEENSVKIHGYEEISDFLGGITEEVLVDASKCNYALYQKIVSPVWSPGIITDLKAIKTPHEIQGFRDSHVRDAVALCTYFAWLENELREGRVHTEYSAALYLKHLRSLEALNMGLSFGSISSVGANAAIIHYKPEEHTASTIVPEKIYLLDSGGHYLDGTIDTTRTVHFGTPSDWEKECYTRVLLGNLDLERVIWPEYSELHGGDLDILARRKLWEKGLNYNHGTGHGVGYFLNVHEGPQGISRGRKCVLKPGMNVSNEPGYYEDGNFGIRIENVMFVQQHPTLDGFLFFENVTMVPYEKNLISLELLGKNDVEYIDKYHLKIWNTLSPIVTERNDQITLEWLRKKTEKLSR